MFALQKSLEQIEDILNETKDQLNIAEDKAEEQASRHQELTGLATRSDELLDDIRERSEEVSKNPLEHMVTSFS